MKETIYTIPVNEAFDTDCECPLCVLHDKLESEAVEYALGAAMMEPDYRIESNEKGYCNKHFSMLYAKTNKLSLALVLDTHLEELRTLLSAYQKQANALRKGRRGLFKQDGIQHLTKNLSADLNGREASCVICDKVAHTMQRYIDVLLYMVEADPEFRKKLENSKGVCLPHLIVLTEAASKKFNHQKAAEFIALLIEKQSAELSRIQEDIHKFTLKFDYRNSDMAWGSAKDAPIRTIEKISGTIMKDNER